MPTVFDARIHQTEASKFPIGQIACGGNKNREATILQVGSSLASLLGKASVRKTHNNDHTSLLISGIENLLGETHTSISFIFHWFKGPVTEEKVLAVGRQSLDITNLVDTIDTLQEDVFYTVMPHRILGKAKSVGA